LPRIAAIRTLRSVVHLGSIRAFAVKSTNVGIWHTTDLRLASPKGPSTSGLQTFSAEGLFTAAFQTWRGGVLKVAF